MATFAQSDFNKFIIDNKVVGFVDSPITLASGRQTQWYVNWRTIASDVYLLDQTVEFLLSFVTELTRAGKLERTPESFYGVPEGATKLGVLTQYKWARQSPAFAPGSHVLSMGRAVPKPHGMPKDKFFVGMPRGATIVLEDVTTTGGSLLTTIDKLLAAEVDIVAAIGLTNRMERRDDGLSVEDAVRSRQSAGKPIPYFYLSSAAELLPAICRTSTPAGTIISAIEEEFREFGIVPLQLGESR